LQREGLCAHNPATDVRAPKAPRRLPRTVDADLMQKVLETPVPAAAEDGDPVLALRDLAIMELFYSSGLRLAELVSLDLTRLDLAAQLVTVLGKGRRERIVPVGAKAVETLRRWLAQRGGLAAADETAV